MHATSETDTHPETLAPEIEFQDRFRDDAPMSAPATPAPDSSAAAVTFSHGTPDTSPEKAITGKATTPAPPTPANAIR